jgi:aspartyl-tRNA(Asn)/glutamyl-tRNA(Gln) amidotransferase subunit B
LSAHLNTSSLDIQHSHITVAHLASIISALSKGKINANAAKLLFKEIWNDEESRFNEAVDAFAQIEQLIRDKGLEQMSDTGALEAIIDTVLASNAKSVEEYKAGNAKAFNALVGQAMKATKGKGNPAQVNELLKSKLG